MSRERTGRDRTASRGEGVRAFRRGLDVLHEVNRSGGIRAGDVARQLDLPRPTVYRLLETLEELGYVVRSASDDRFRVTRRASSLGDGYDPRIGICAAAAPHLVELSRRLVWPVDLSTYSDAAMVIQETTHPRSPLSIDRGMIGERLPMLRTSAGRAYLAACDAREHDVIVSHLHHLDEPEDRPFLEPARLSELMAQTRQRGFAIRSDGEFKPKTASIAVAIVRGETVFGCLSIIWIRSALSLEDALRRFVKPMQDTANAIPVEVELRE